MATTVHLPVSLSPFFSQLPLSLPLSPFFPPSLTHSLPPLSLSLYSCSIPVVIVLDLFFHYIHLPFPPLLTSSTLYPLTIPSCQAASDDPPFLSVGTEVSAKYRGAFCEATVKVAKKQVKCKVRL